MAVKSIGQSELMRTPFRNFTSNDEGTWPYTVITAAGAAESARRLIMIDETLKRIEQLLMNLGTDGIHDLIRLEARRVRTRQRKQRQAAAEKRKRTIAAKRKAGGR